MSGPRTAYFLAGRPESVFRITVHSLSTGQTVAVWIWERSHDGPSQLPGEASGPYLPAEDIFSVWDEQVRLDAVTEKEARDASD